jgi:hypothetical protein
MTKNLLITFFGKSKRGALLVDCSQAPANRAKRPYQIEQIAILGVQVFIDLAIGNRHSNACMGEGEKRKRSVCSRLSLVFVESIV